MFSIIFAVLIALWLEAEYDDREMNQRADQMLLRIEAEIKGNKTDIDSAIKNNQENIKLLSEALEQQSYTFGLVKEGFQISAGSSSDAAWVSAQMTDTLSVMPIDTVTQLANLYDSQRYYVSYARFFIEQYTDLTSEAQAPDSGKVAAAKFLQHLRIMNSLAEQLVVNYNAYLKIEVKEE